MRSFEADHTTPIIHFGVPSMRWANVDRHVIERVDSLRGTFMTDTPANRRCLIENVMKCRRKESDRRSMTCRSTLRHRMLRTPK